MNGAELPCGSLLRVEPADSNNDNKQYGLRTTQEAERGGEELDESGNTTRVDDLDEFFASL